MAGQVAKADTSANELCNKLTNRISLAVFFFFSLSDSYICRSHRESLQKSKIKIRQTETETEEIGNGVSERKGDEIESESENENREGVTGELHRFRSL